MRTIAVYWIALVGMLGVASYAVAEGADATDDSIPFLYESRAEIPVGDDVLAPILSRDYRYARDEFTRYDLLEKMRPVIAKRLAEAKSTEVVTFRIGSKLGEYDFNKKVFPTGFSDATFIPYDRGYAATFSNAGGIAVIPVSVDDARRLSSSLANDRRVGVIVYAKITGVEESSLNMRRRKILRTEIIRADFEHNSGVEIGSIELQ